MAEKRRKEVLQRAGLTGTGDGVQASMICIPVNAARLMKAHSLESMCFRSSRLLLINLVTVTGKPGFKDYRTMLHLKSESDGDEENVERQPSVRQEVPSQEELARLEAQLEKCERARSAEFEYAQMKVAEENALARHHAALEKLADERANMNKAKEELKEVRGTQKRKPLQLKHDGKTMKELTDELKAHNQVVRELMNAVDMLREAAFEAKCRPDSGGVSLRRGTRRRSVGLREPPTVGDSHSGKGTQLTERQMVRLALAESFSDSVTVGHEEYPYRPWELMQEMLQKNADAVAGGEFFEWRAI
eukprot:6193871-Pleurochrysis_carterae.AAC.1